MITSLVWACWLLSGSLGHSNRWLREFKEYNIYKVLRRVVVGHPRTSQARSPLLLLGLERQGKGVLYKPRKICDFRKKLLDQSIWRLCPLVGEHDHQHALEWFITYSIFQEENLGFHTQILLSSFALLCLNTALKAENVKFWECGVWLTTIIVRMGTASGEKMEIDILLVRMPGFIHTHGCLQGTTEY